jgi:hypothetical protein
LQLGEHVGLTEYYIVMEQHCAVVTLINREAAGAVAVRMALATWADRRPTGAVRPCGSFGADAGRRGETDHAESEHPKSSMIIRTVTVASDPIETMAWSAIRPAARRAQNGN